MESRRKTISNSQSGIPIPASANRPTSRQSLAHHQPPNHNTNTNRLSLAPGRSLAASRSSSATNLAPSTSSNQLDQFNNNAGGSQGSQMFSQGHGGPREAPGTASRVNMYTSAGAMSASRSNTVLRSGGQPVEYAPPSQRRSSSYRKSMAGTVMSTPGGGRGGVEVTRLKVDPRDPKPLPTRQRMANEISSYLATIGEHVEPKTLLTPTAKDFKQILKTLISRLDRTYPFAMAPTTTGQQKGATGNQWTEEVIPALKVMMYPFPESITKSHLHAIGSQTSWPNMLAMLHWFVTLILNREAAFDNAPELHIPAPYDEEDPVFGADGNAHAWLDYAGKCYPKFLATADFEPGQSEELEAFYSRINGSRQRLRDAVEEHEADHELLLQESKKLLAEPDPLKVVQDEFARLERDRIKMVNYLKTMEQKIDSTVENSRLLALEKIKFEKQRASNGEEIKTLVAAIKLQDISPEEAQDMITARSNTDAAVKVTEQKYADLNKKKLDLEIDLQRALDQTTRLCTTYEVKAKALGVLPHPPAGYEHVNFDQEVYGASENPVPDCQSLLRPALIQLRAETKSQYGKLNDEDVLLEEQISLIKERIADFRDAFEAGESERNQADQANADAKEASAIEFTSINTEQDRLQSIVNTISATMGNALAAAEWRFEQRLLERTKVIEDTSALRRATHNALEQAIDDIVEYRVHITKQTETIVLLAEE